MERTEMPRCINQSPEMHLVGEVARNIWATDYGLRTADQDHEVARAASWVLAHEESLRRRGVLHTVEVTYV